MNAEIIEKLKAAGINPVGCYEKLPVIIEDAISTVRVFGFDYWLKNTCSGIAIKKIVKELA